MANLLGGSLVQGFPLLGRAGTDNFIPKFNGNHKLVNSLLMDDGTNMGVGTVSPTQKLDVNGTIKATGLMIGTTLMIGPDALMDYNKLKNVPATFVPVTHNHDDRYYTEAEADTRFLAIGGNAVSATKLATARTFTLTGDVTATGVSFDGTGNVSIATVFKNSGVVAGTYPKVTVDIKGNITAGTSLVAADIPNLDWVKITSGKPTTLSGYGIGDAFTKLEVQSEIAKVVGAAPGTLDTLNELAIALGNDPNFATTISTQIGKKADVAHNHSLNSLSNVTMGTVSAGQVVRWNGSAWVNSTIAAADIPDASLTARGVVQLTDALNSNSVSLAATASSVKTAYDLGAAALSRTGGTMTGSLVLSTMLQDSRLATNKQLINVDASGANIYIGNPVTRLNLESSAEPSLTINGVSRSIYHTGNFSPTTKADVTSIYTRTETDRKISELVDSAPVALDTLKKLATAIGNDAAFAATMTTALATKAATTHNHTLNELSNVTITSPVVNQVVKWNGTQFVNSSLASTDVPDGTMTAKGVVQLSNAVNSTSTTLAATPSGVKAAYDLGAAALPKTGGTLTGPLNGTLVTMLGPGESRFSNGTFIDPHAAVAYGLKVSQGLATDKVNLSGKCDMVYNATEGSLDFVFS